MPNNYVLLEKITVGAAGAASVTFANIPQTGYTDLVIKCSMRTNGTSFSGAPWQNLSVALNSNTGNAYRQLFGTGSGTGSDQQNAGLWATSGAATTNTFSNNEIYIPNYTSSAVKTISIDNVTENNGTDFAAVLWAASYSGVTASVTTVTLTPLSGSLLQFSTFYLYGVAKLGTTPAIAPKASGGDIIMTDGTYWYHAFRASGTFTPALNLTSDVLVIAGGGSGGTQAGAGGGAGGLLLHSNQSLTAQNYTCTVGAGGAGATGAPGNNGSNSQFASLTASVGGGGGANYANLEIGKSGGSGGGGYPNSIGTAAGGAATSGQGNNGGSGSTDNATYRSAGGGGGAGAAGGNGNTSAPAVSGAGGNGVSTYSAWGLATGTGQNISGTVWFAGGGGGANTGLGAGGNGGGTAGSATTSTAGTANTGGGSGGGNTTGAGGSGIVIIRYLVA
jgi:hypothetical protein